MGLSHNKDSSLRIQVSRERVLETKQHAGTVFMSIGPVTGKVNVSKQVYERVEATKGFNQKCAENMKELLVESLSVGAQIDIVKLCMRCVLLTIGGEVREEDEVTEEAPIEGVFLETNVAWKAWKKDGKWHGCAPSLNLSVEGADSLQLVVVGMIKQHIQAREKLAAAKPADES